MTTFKLTLELALNSRTTAGLDKAEQYHADDYGYTIMGGKFILVTLQGLDFGRYDAEGDKYVAELLNIVEADILYSYIEEVL